MVEFFQTNLLVLRGPLLNIECEDSLTSALDETII